MPVAGATSGVGWESARILAERGALVLVHARTAEEARAATGRLIAAGVSEPHLCTYATDLTDSGTAEAMVRAVVGPHPHLDVRAYDERVGPAPPATGARLKRPQRRPEPGVLAAAFPYTRLRNGPTMIELLPHRLPALSRWFPAGAPGPAALAEHVLTTGIGRFWADHAVHPRAIAVDCAAHVLLRGDPGALVPAELAPLGSRYIEAPARFLPVLGASFDRIMPWERMVYIRQEEPTSPARTPKGVTVRRITAADADSLAALGPGAAWIHASWGGPAGLAGSGHAWGAFHQGEAVAVACTYFLGSAYEDLAVVTAADHRRRQLALSCVTALCADVTARGHTPSWSCSRHNRASRLLAWNAGFRLVREYVHHATGAPAVRGMSGTRIPA
ncbi:SDR family NAD(P)-dependent oxidoreductase [Streptomyces sp. NPDC005506]|uniref:SDR family NAD(P)-dependent oxidoreductase n=1 Tax=unclassified Streptomyces TaxID=2593676 RepID=UPI0036A74A19